MFTEAGPDYDSVRDHLFDQYEKPSYDDRTGLPREVLEAQFETLLAEGEESGKPDILIKAELFEYMLKNARIDVDPEDWFADHFDHADHILYRLHETKRKAFGAGPLAADKEVLDRSFETGAFSAELDLGHISPGWQFLLKKGIPGILQELEKALSETDADKEPGKAAFYQAAVRTERAALAFIGRLQKQACRMKEEHPEAADRMEKLSACLAKLSAGAPETFYEALELAYLFHQFIEFEGEYVRSMGSFERNFGAFYEADLAAGRITEEDAKELIRYFFMKFYANTRGSGNGKNFYFGGLSDAETEAVGPLSYLALEVFYELNQTDPKLSIKISRKTPERFLRLIGRCLRDGRTNMVIVNDEETLEALKKRGIPEQEAYHYLLIGCYEPAIEGQEAACNMCVKMNLLKPVELALFNGLDPVTGRQAGPETGDAESFTDFEQFYDAYEKQLSYQLSRVQGAIRNYEHFWNRINPEPFLSSTFEPCIASGKDISEAGARWNNTGSMGAGLANAADSLLAVKKTVFENKTLTVSALREMLLQNFTGHELKRAQLLKLPKWGNNQTEADEMAARVTRSYTSRVNGIPNGRGGIFTASMFTLDHAFTLGHRTGATPDGREKGHYLAKGIGAMTGLDKAGVTGQILSVSKLDFTDIPNGSVLDIYLHPSAVTEEKGIDTLVQLIQTYFRRGGYGIQFNILNAEDLKKAQQEPEEYKTLQVRVCGWNVYFVTLNREQQDHFIETTMQMV